MSSVLVGVDGSENSKVALRWAAGCADAMGVPLRAVWAWMYPSDAVLSIGGVKLPEPRQADELIEAQLRALLEEVLAEAGARVKVQAARGPATGALLRAAEDRPATIVVGSRGLGGFKGLLLGSVSRQLCEHAPCPVTIVRPSVPVDPAQIKTLLVGVDGSAHAARALSFAGHLAETVDAELVVAYAAGPSEVDPVAGLEALRDRVDQWCAPLRDRGLAYRLAVVAGDPRSALLDVARDRSADLVVVGSRGRGPIKKLLLGSVASTLAHHSQLPVTIVPLER